MTNICMKQEQMQHLANGTTMITTEKESPFIHVNVPCVTLFVLGYKHLVCLGVMK